ncbi:MAG: hypothetical protein WAO28_00340 [Candidatus Microsaccharimonas sp.]
MAEQTDYEKILFDRSVNLLRTNGILSIVFGSLGAFFGLLFMALFALAMTASETSEDAAYMFLMGVGTLVLFILPHIYLIISGVHLLRQPSPNVARTLVIITLVIGVFWNLITLIFSILNLTQLRDYEVGYNKHIKAHQHKA